MYTKVIMRVRFVQRRENRTMSEEQRNAADDRRRSKRRKFKRANVLSENFDKHLQGITHERLLTLTALGFALVPLFFILDYYTLPKETLFRIGTYRLISTLLLLAQFFVIRQTRPGKLSYLHGNFVSINVAGIIALMIVDIGGFNSSYYAGLNLVMIAVNLLLPWNAFHSTINCTMVISIYIVLNIWSGPDYDHRILFNNLFFLFATAVITISINYVKHRLVRQEFLLLIELKKARDALWSEIELAKRIQTALLPEKEEIEGYEIAAAMTPAKEVGGDYYDVIETSNGEKWVTIGDVSGHGVDSGLIMMMAQTSIQATVNNGSGASPSEILKKANKVIRENLTRLGSDHYMTIMAIRFDEKVMTVAGKHQDIIIYRSLSNKIEHIETGGTWLGITDDIEKHIKDTFIPLDKGDLVLLFTDGITDATNEHGELFGQERLENALHQFADLTVRKILEKILCEVSTFQKDQMDDMTLMIIRKGT
ncbi:PP2C family protein-serine/threonine phosphatase [Desulfosarcina sp.]|uniref:PP2C family protein-serine/threonine phosphatase n=1 Tax=Desulfosarcina sp. TaxID=2027861 RepID=UPI003565645D